MTLPSLPILLTLLLINFVLVVRADHSAQTILPPNVFYGSQTVDLRSTDENSQEKSNLPVPGASSTEQYNRFLRLKSSRDNFRLETNFYPTLTTVLPTFKYQNNHIEHPYQLSVNEGYNQEMDRDQESGFSANDYNGVSRINRYFYHYYYYYHWFEYKIMNYC